MTMSAPVNTRAALGEGAGERLVSGESLMRPGYGKSGASATGGVGEGQRGAREGAGTKKGPDRFRPGL